MTRFQSENDILSEAFRKQVIEEIVNSEENQERKFQALRRDEVYKDQNKKWVMEAIKKEGYKADTIEQIRNRATNISVAKKIVNKKARAYTGGVERSTEKKTDQESITSMETLLNLDKSMRRWDRMLELHRNTLLKIVPLKNERETRVAATGKVLYEIAVRVLTPWQYDVIEDPYNKERPAVVIESEFAERGDIQNDQEGANGIRGYAPGQTNDGKNQIVADSPEDEQAERKRRRFIWWSDSFHFTTDFEGKIVDSANDMLENPIGILPYVNAAKDQDGYFWAKGGDDLVDGSLSLNKGVTDIKFIEWLQGWGQLVIAAKNVPKNLVGGPDKAFIFEKEAGDTVDVSYASSNPPISEMLETVRTELAMLLSTNGLSTRHVSAELKSSDVVSGIALMVEEAEVMTDITDSRDMFAALEQDVWELLNAWWSLYSEIQALVPWQQEVKPLSSVDMTTKFLDAKAPVTEKEKVDVLKARKEAGLITHVQMLRADNPDLSEEDAKKLAAEIQAEKAAAAPQMNPSGDGTPNQPPKPGEKPEPNVEDDEEENDDQTPA